MGLNPDRLTLTDRAIEKAATMIGERLGKWVIFQELGRGGMGRVFLANEEIGGRQAALKVLAGELAQEVGFLERFQREIDMLSRLDHPGIVRFYESGFENGLYFYAMEYVAGQSLDDLLRERGALPWPEVLDIARQICPALKHVHDHGIIHRDLKPPNLLRTAAGQIKLSDFGIAKLFASSHLTATGGVVGTAEYLSPEQAAGKPVTKKSDLYSFGVVLYNLLTGRMPFEGATFVDLLHKHRYAQFDRPQKFVPDLPYEIDELVCQLLEKDPDKRPADCQVLGRQVERLQGRLARKSSPTQAGDDATLAQNRPKAVLMEEIGPATLMSRLVREELQRQAQGGPLSQILNRGWVLATLLAIVTGILIWTFWPAGAQELFKDGARLMESPHQADWNRAFRDYFEPLQERFPDHPYGEDVRRYRAKLEAVRKPDASEAKRFFQQGERLREEGQFKSAQRVWHNVVAAFGDCEAEQVWVERSRQALQELEKAGGGQDRWQAVRPALQKAAALAEHGRRAEAELTWKALEELYRDDPYAADLMAEIAKARSP